VSYKYKDPTPVVNPILNKALFGKAKLFGVGLKLFVGI